VGSAIRAVAADGSVTCQAVHVSGRPVIVSTRLEIPAAVLGSTDGNTSVFCPVGHLATGGGVSAQGMTVQASSPGSTDGRPDYWLGAARNDDPNKAHQLYVAVICVPFSD
jgi:hypothetical protein